MAEFKHLDLVEIAEQTLIEAAKAAVRKVIIDRWSFKHEKGGVDLDAEISKMALKFIHEDDEIKQALRQNILDSLKKNSRHY